MRVKLTLLACGRETLLPLSYNHALSGLIYSTLGNASKEYASRLHEEGFDSGDRRFKLFTFSRLSARRSRVTGDRLLLTDGRVSFQISSPMDEFIEHFVAGLFQSEEFRIAGARFNLEQAETLPAPVIGERMRLRALSPITESVRDESDRVRFLGVEDEWSGVIERNLVRKYRALWGREPAVSGGIRWTWDREYLAEWSRQGKRASVLITIKEDAKVRGWLAPFTIEGDRELIALGYEAGFGARNSMGFGMAEVGL